MKVQITEEMKKEMTEDLTERLTGALDAESNEPKPFNLRARIAHLMSQATNEIQKSHAEDMRIFSLTSIEYWPIRMRQLRNQINHLSEIAGELLKPYADKIANIRLGIAEQTKDGKPAFSNEDKRKAELDARLASWPEYQADLSEHAALTGAIRRLSLDLDSTIDEFRAARLMYERETAQIIAAGIQITAIEE